MAAPLLLAQIGLNLAQGWANRENAQTQNWLNKRAANLRNRIRLTENQAAAMVGAAQRRRQSADTRRKLTTGAEAQDAVGRTLARLSDSMSVGTLQSRMASAEAAGALVAAAGNAGVGGSTLDMLEMTEQLRAQITERGKMSATEQQMYELSQQRNSMVANSLLATDSSVVIDNLDYQPHRAQRVLEPSWGQIIFETAAKTFFNNDERSESNRRAAVDLFSRKEAQVAPPSTSFNFSGVNLQL